MTWQERHGRLMKWQEGHGSLARRTNDPFYGHLWLGGVMKRTHLVACTHIDDVKVTHAHVDG